MQDFFHPQYELNGLDMVYIGIIWFIHGLHMNYMVHIYIYMVYKWFTYELQGIYMVYIYTWFIHRV